MLFATNAKAQLFTYYSDESSDFTTAELLKLDSLRNNPAYDSVVIVEVGDLWSLQDSGDLHVNIMGSNVTNAKVNRVELNSMASPSDGYIWEGTFIDELENDDEVMEPDFDGKVYLIKKDGEIFGFLRPFGQTTEYKLVSLGVGKNALIRYNESFVNENSNCQATVSTEMATASTSSGPCEPTRVLVLYTPEAKWAVANIDHEIYTAMGLLDGATWNSLGALNAYAKFSLAGIQMIGSSQYATTGNIEYDLGQLKINTYAQYYRDIYKADFVVCLTNANYYNNTANNKKVGNSKVGVSDADAYAIIEANQANNKYTFSHEIGHLSGCRHQQSWVFSMTGYEHDDAGGTAHGYGVNKGSKKYNDIMHVKTPNGIREHYYSNPAIAIHGKSFGTTASNNAAFELLLNSCTSSELRTDEFNHFDAIIKGSAVTSTGNTVSLTAEPYFGYAGYKFEWYVSFDGGANWSYLNTNNPVLIGSTSFTMPDVAKAIVWMKATDGVNQWKVTTKTIYNQHPKWAYPVWSGGSFSYKTSTNIASNTTNKPSLYVTPNPTNGIVQIAVDLSGNSTEQKTKIEITDMFGRVVKEKTISFNQEIWEVDLKGLPTNTYIVHLKGGTYSETRKLQVIN